MWTPHKVWNAFLTDHITLEGQVYYIQVTSLDLFHSSAVLTQRLVSQLSSQELPEPPMRRRLIDLSHENYLLRCLRSYLVIRHFRRLLSSERCQTGQVAQSGKYLPYKYEDMSLTSNTQVKHWMWWNVPGETESGHWSVGLANLWAPDELQVKVRGQSRGHPPAFACIFTCTPRHVHVHTQSQETVLTCHLISSTLGVLTAACEPQPDREREGDLDVLGFNTEILKTPFSRLKRRPSS